MPTRAKRHALRGPLLAALRRMPSSVEMPRPRHRWTRGRTLATLLELGLIERVASGFGLYRRTAIGDAVVSRMMAEIYGNTEEAKGSECDDQHSLAS